MVDDEDNWPLPEYNPGPQKHLHALGAISTNFNEFETRLFGLFAHHLDVKKVPRKVIDALYFQASEAQRLENIKLVYRECEADEPVRECVSRLVLYFKWCSDTRNALVHSRHDPPFFGHDQNTLHLTKRVKKTSERGFLKLKLTTLRNVADKIRIGERLCLNLIIHLQLRDTPTAEWSTAMQLLAPTDLPVIPDAPPRLELSQTPHTPPPPSYLRRK